MREFRIKKSLTDRTEESLQRYLNDISKYPMIAPAEEVLLAGKIKCGDLAAEHRLITANLRFVVSCAKKYQHMGIPLADLVCEGNLGLIRAARLFDETKGFKFISYAVWWIRQSMISALNEQLRIIRVPVNQQIGMSEINRVALILEQKLEREPSMGELSEAMGKSIKYLTDTMYSNSRGSYLEDLIPGSESGEHTLLMQLAGGEYSDLEQLIDHEARREMIDYIFHHLEPREQEIIFYAFGLCGRPKLENQEIAERIGLSKERVRQIRAHCLKKIGDLPRIEKLKEYA